MRTASIAVAAFTLGAATLAMTRDAHALGPVDVEVGARVGLATSPASTASSNLLGFGLGARGGLDFLGFYGGVQFMYYFGGTDHSAALCSAVPGTPSCPKTGSAALCGLPPIVAQYAAEAFVASDRSTVDTFLAQHGLQSTTLAARQAGVRSLHDPQLLGRRERAPGSTRHRLYSAAPCTTSTLTLLALRGLLSLSLRHRFRHDRRSSLRPSAHRFPGGTVSGDIGTGGRRAVIDALPSSPGSCPSTMVPPGSPHPRPVTPSTCRGPGDGSATARVP